MSDDLNNDFDSELLDLHLGQLPLERRAALMQRIATDARLAREHEALQSLFSALASARDVGSVPENLVEGVVKRVRAAGRPPRVVRRNAEESPAYSERPGIFVRVRSMRDVLAVAATIVLLVGLGVPSVLRVRERRQRFACSANLAQLGRGLAAYATVFNNALPFYRWSQATSWQPTDDRNVELVPNRQHVYRLLQVGIVRDPAQFVCPSQWAVPMSAEQVKRNNDFLEARNLSYGYQNMAGVRPSLNSDANLPIMADDNPLFDNGLPLGLSYGASANSRSHGGAGQNVLTLGGQVKWMTTPDCGVDGDNIWTLQNVRRYTGREGPETATDSHLLK